MARSWSCKDRTAAGRWVGGRAARSASSRCSNNAQRTFLLITTARRLRDQLTAQLDAADSCPHARAETVRGNAG